MMGSEEWLLDPYTHTTPGDSGSSVRGDDIDIGAISIYLVYSMDI